MRTGTMNQFAVRWHCSELCHYDLKQGSNSVLDYFTKLRGVWKELNSHRQCLVVRAFINASMRAVCEFCLEDQVIQFLIGLNDSLSVVKTQVLLMEHLPSINKVYFIVIQEESNSVALLPSSVAGATSDESNTLVNTAYDLKKFQDRGKGPNFNGYGK
jgi:hypothetical protein